MTSAAPMSRRRGRRDLRREPSARRNAVVALVAALVALAAALPPTVAMAAEPTDLEITQSAAPDPVAVGGELVWTIVVRNLGPGAASGVEVNDNFNQFGDITEFVSLSSTQGTCTNSASTFNCQLGSIAAGASATMTLTVRVLHSGDVVNVADVTTGSTDTDWSNNHVTGSGSAGPAADLQLTKTVSPTSVSRGDTVQFTLDVRNEGPSAATGVVLTDVLPDGLVDVLVEPAESCALLGSEVSCDVADLADGASFSATVTATIDPGFAGETISNVATVTASSPDSDLSNNTDTATIEINASSADVAVVKRLDSPQLIAGEVVRYVIEVSNVGPSEAEDVLLEDTLPAELITPSVSPETGECAIAGTVLSCELGTLPPGATIVITVTGTLRADAAGSVANTVEVTSSAPDPDLENNVSETTSPVESVADVSITKSTGAAAVSNGDPVTYTLRVVNTGPSDTSAVVVRDELPESLEYQPGSCTTPQGSCTVADGALVFTLGSVPSGASLDLSFVAVVAADAPDGMIRNTATVSHDATDPILENNTAVHDLNVDAAADLVLSKSADPASGTAGEAISFTIRANNAGPGESTNLTLRDVVPAEVDLTSVVPSVGTCEISAGNTVACTLSSLAAGEEWVVTVHGVLHPDTPRGQLRNTAIVTGDQDPTASNNVATAVVPVATRSELEITKDGPATALAGTEIEYALQVSNTGPSTAAETVVIDRLPAGTVLVEGGTDQVACDTGGADRRFVRCDIGDLAPGAAVSIPVTVSVGTGVEPGTTLVNTAHVTSTTPGISDGTIASVLTEVLARADLSVMKSVSPDVPVAGGPITYLVRVHNDGPSAASGVELDDTLPAELVVESVSTTSGSCAEPAGQTLSCQRDRLDPGATWRIVVIGTVRADAEGRMTNRAEVTSDTPDLESGNDVATVSTELEQSADLAVVKWTPTPQLSHGDTAVFLLSVINLGPSIAHSVELRDEMPQGLSIEAVHSDACSESAPSNITCTYDELDPGAIRTVLITARVEPDATAGQLTNSASVSSATADPQEGNNTATAVIAVSASADLSLRKSVEPHEVAPGGTVTYTLDITNNGPSAAEEVLLSDSLPDGLTAESVEVSSELSCEIRDEGGTVSCEAASLPPGRYQVLLAVHVPDDASTGSITNTASIDAATEDPVPENNVSAASLDVIRPVVPPTPPGPGLAITGWSPGGLILLGAVATAAGIALVALSFNGGTARRRRR